MAFVLGFTVLRAYYRLSTVQTQQKEIKEGCYFQEAHNLFGK